MKAKMSYVQCIEWIVLNDCPEPNFIGGHIAAFLVSDIFERDIDLVMKDIYEMSKQMEMRHEG